MCLGFFLPSDAARTSFPVFRAFQLSDLRNIPNAISFRISTCRETEAGGHILPVEAFPFFFNLACKVQGQSERPFEARTSTAPG